MATKPDYRKQHMDEPDANRDPITGTPGAHPVGAGLGAAGAGAAGAAIGAAVGGPIGAAAGAVIGGVAGGLGGKAAAESVNPTLEDAYWRENYVARPYVEDATDYGTYRPAYEYGWVSYSQYAPMGFEEVEPKLEKGWTEKRAASALPWVRAKDAARDAWDRCERLTKETARHGR